MPINELIKLSLMDRKTFNRFESASKCLAILRAFFKKGFRSYRALESIVVHYYPEVSKEQLHRFWHLRQFDDDMSVILEDVFEKLKA